MSSRTWSINQDGFEVLRAACQKDSLRELDEILSAVSRLDLRNVRQRGAETYAMRNVLRENRLVATLRKLDSLISAVKGYTGKCCAVRGIYFDKPFKANWSVPWHQDLTIAVAGKHEVDGYSKWTTKSGVVHVQPPTEILEKMITARIHLDDADERNGALMVVAKSNQRGYIPAREVREVTMKSEVARCDVQRGDIMLMRPLLLHSSRSSQTNLRRRVLHIEFCAEELPTPLEWCDRIDLG
ncbi:MAG: phytanoyl-CoA dioxygenase family protein [Leptospirales bacterium]|nr:phytanoyl-CoA dioxygenase family protein [Leptospirales bacterium]